MDILQKTKTYYKNFCDKLESKKGFDFFYNRGVDNYLKKSYYNAVKDFETAMAKEDVKPQVYYNLALVYHNINDYDKAIEYYTKFLEVSPFDYDAMYNLALTLYGKGDFERAIEQFKKVIEIKKEPEGVMAFVRTYLAVKKLDEIEALANELLEIPKNGVKLYFAIARVFETQTFGSENGFIDKAIEMYSKIVEKEPQNDNALLSISICYAKKGEWDKAIEFCDKALNINPKSFDANNQMGLIYYCKQEIDEAIKYYSVALKLKPSGDCKIYANLAYAYETKGEYKKAIKIFNTLLWKFPQYPAREEIKNHVRILKSLNY